MRFEEAYTGWQEGHLTQEDAARLLGVCDRTFRRQIDRYETDGMDALLDKRLTQRSHKRAPVDEVIGLVDLYRKDYAGWNVKHFHTCMPASMTGSAAIHGSRTSCSRLAQSPAPKRVASTVCGVTTNRCPA